MNTVIKIVSCDTETTGLSYKTHCIRAIGLSIATVNLATGCEVAERLRAEASGIPYAQYWDPETLEWAKEQSSWPAKPYVEALDDIHQELREFLASYIEECELHEALWVFNHPEFDVPFLEQVLPDFRKVVNYKCIFDLQSMMIGKLGIHGKNKALQEQKERLGPVTHGALEDADRQLDLILDNQLFRL